jgi:hypothetical protein
MREIVHLCPQGEVDFFLAQSRVCDAASHHAERGASIAR